MPRSSLAIFIQTYLRVTLPPSDVRLASVYGRLHLSDATELYVQQDLVRVGFRLYLCTDSKVRRAYECSLSLDIPLKYAPRAHELDAVFRPKR